MIFIILGSREYQFDRLLRKIDYFIDKYEYKGKVFAQIGSSKYIPKYYEYEKYLDKVQFEVYQNNAEIIISHGGTGALISSIKKRKKVIGVPRMAKFNEHTDDHQFQIIELLENEGYISSVKSEDLGELEYLLNHPEKIPSRKYNNFNIMHKIIMDFLELK